MSDLNYYFHLEDVLLTGIAAEKVGVRHVHSFDWRPLAPDPSDLSVALSVHYVKDDAAIVEAWNQYLNVIKAKG